jgi:penicillin-binding protein 1B
LNVPAIEVAQRAGYGVVADLAHKAGLADVRATPSMALGTYDVTPLSMAGAYTIFANNGVMVAPRFISHIVDKSGNEVWSSRPDQKQILDPRVNFLVVSMMQDVLRWGTGAGVRARGFTLPAAGKTGTSHDAWFAGFTSKLLCIVWVGLDDYHDIKLEGAQAALPIWTGFMKRAHQHRAYRDVTAFSVPDGIVMTQIDSLTGQLATSACPATSVRSEYYLAATQPVQFCPLHTGGSTEIAAWGDANLPKPPPIAGEALPNGQFPSAVETPEAMPDASSQQHDKQQRDKKGFLDKLKTIFH